ncbi:unnamed protein product [Phytomonas sp. EM1]|nr:unnamed protein product [Phytomonas sp. EM1]|eukprot:CCW59970.1 unnamed protein product [Phytomonas sp. isolate EM1]
METTSGTVFSPSLWEGEPFQVVIPPGVYGTRPFSNTPTTSQNVLSFGETNPKATVASSSRNDFAKCYREMPRGPPPPMEASYEPPSRESKLDDPNRRPGCALHSTTHEVCHSLRASAAERALARLQKENDELKRNIIGYKKQQQALQGVVNRLRSELEAMGTTVMEQNATLCTLSGAVQRHDPCHLIREKRKARVLRYMPSAEGLQNSLEALQTERQLLQKECKEKDGIISKLKKLLNEVQPPQTQVPETIDVEESEAPRSVVSCEAFCQEANTTEGLQRMVVAFNRLLDRYEGFSPVAFGEFHTDDAEAAEDEIVTLCMRVLSCADLAYPQELFRGLGSEGRLQVVVRGPFGRDVLFKTPEQTTQTAFPIFSNGPSNEGRFRIARDVFGRLEVEVWAGREVEPGRAALLLGRTSIPVNALLSNPAKGSRPTSSSAAAAAEAGPICSLYTMKLFDPAKEGQVVGEVCFEVEVRKGPGVGRLGRSSEPVVSGLIVDSPDPPTTAEAERPTKETTRPGKAAERPLSPPTSSSTASYREVLRVSSDRTTSPRSAVDEEGGLSHRSNAHSVPAEAVPENLSGGILGTEPVLRSSSEAPQAPLSPAVNLYIYAKEGYRFTEGREDEVLEELVDYRTRVLVWIDEQLIFTVPETCGNLKVHWSSEDSAFITAVEPNQTIRFEVQAIRGDSDEDTIGETSVKVSEIFSSKERSATLKLPVMLNGLQCGSLVVEFCKSSKLNR